MSDDDGGGGPGEAPDPSLRPNLRATFSAEPPQPVPPDLMADILRLGPVGSRAPLPGVEPGERVTYRHSYPLLASDMIYLGSRAASAICGTSPFGADIMVSESGQAPAGIFKQWTSKTRVPVYPPPPMRGVRVDYVDARLKALVLGLALPPHWRVVEGKPDAKMALSYCVVSLVSRNYFIDSGNFAEWCHSLGTYELWSTPRLAAYTQFTGNQALMTTSAVAELGCYVWAPLDDLLAAQERVPPMARPRFKHFMERLKLDDRRAVGGMLDAGVVFQQRTISHKRRNHFDLATVVHCAYQTWVNPAVAASRKVFWSSVECFLLHCSIYNWRYERMLFTFAQLFGDKYWPTKLAMYLEHDMLSLSDESWLPVCKLMTTYVLRSFMVPFTTHRSDASLTFLYLHYMLGWSSDMDPAGMKTVVVNTIRAKLASNDYQVKGDSAAYYQLFEEGVRGMLTPIVERYGARMEPWDEYCRSFGGGMSSGACGRRVREHFGKGVAPAGASRSYVAARMERKHWHHDPGELYVELAVKFNEKGEQRHLMARELLHHAREKWFWSVAANRGPMHGGDIGERPLEEVLRKICLARETTFGSIFPGNGPTLLDLDYAHFDEEVECREKLIVQQVLLDLMRLHAPRSCREDLERIGAYILRSEVEQVVRTSFLTEPDVKAMVQELMKDSDRLEWVADDALRIKYANSQDSGAFTTLEANTLFSRARMHVRDSELKPRDRPIRRFARSDDISELYGCWTACVRSFGVFEALGLVFNAYKQRACHISRVYFRDMYVAGAIIGAPARAVHALLSGQPLSKPSPMIEVERLRAVSDACSRAVRRGMDAAFIKHMYCDAENFYRKVRVKDDSRPGWHQDVWLSRDAIRAPSEQGGCGVLQPWVAYYDWTQACASRRYTTDADDRLRTMGIRRSLPGASEYVSRVCEQVKRDTGLEVGREAAASFQLRTKISRLAGDGSGEVQQLEAQRTKSVLPRRPHRVVARKPYQCLETPLRSFFRDAYRALDNHDHMRNAAHSMRSTDPPAACGAMDALHGGVGREMMRACRDGPSGEKSIAHKMLRATHTGQAFLEQAAHWPWERQKDWLLGGWVTGYNPGAVPSVGMTIVKRLQQVQLADWAPYAHTRRGWLLRGVSAGEAGLRSLMKLKTRMLLH